MAYARRGSRQADRLGREKARGQAGRRAGKQVLDEQTGRRRTGTWARQEGLEDSSARQTTSSIGGQRSLSVQHATPPRAIRLLSAVSPRDDTRLSHERL
jgi:hypothetical protein